jgi:hypothetical protein
VIQSVLGRSGSLAVTWVAPAENGGEPITSYVISATANGSTTTVSAAGTASTATIGGLVDGTAYAVSVEATNAVGSSAAATGTGTPQTAYEPGSPSEVTASPNGSGAISVTWIPPVDDGGSALTGFDVSWQQVVPGPNGTYVPAPGSSLLSVTTPATAVSELLPASSFTPSNALYSINVAAVNAVGTGESTPTSSPVAPVTTVTTKAVPLTAATMRKLASDTPAPSGTGNILVWPTPVPSQITKLKVGKILVAAPEAPVAPDGLLDTVTAISVDSGGDYTVTTAPAALTSVFTSLALSSSSNPLLDGSGSAEATAFRPAMAGVRDLPDASISYDSELDLGVNLSTGDNGGFVSGELDLEPDVSLALSLDHDWIGIPNGVGISASASVAAKASLSVGIQGEIKHQIGEIDSPPIDIQIGPIPVVIDPKIPVYLTLSGKAGIQVSASATVGASVSWNSHHAGTLNVQNLSTGVELSGGPVPGWSLTGELATGISVEPEVEIYDAAGPDVDAGVELDTDIQLPAPPGGDYITITPKVEIEAGFTVNVLGYNANLDVTLATVVGPSFTLVHGPSASLNISPADPSTLPGETIQFSTTRSDGATGYPVTWSLVGAAGDTISQSGLFTASGPSARTVTVDAFDSAGAVGTTTVKIGTPFEGVGNLTATQDATNLGAQVRWTAPSQTGGTPPASYTVTVSNGIASQTTSGLSVSLPPLQPGIDYTVTVYPTNTAGQTGPAASTSLFVYPLCTDTFTGGSTGSGTTWDTPANWSTGKTPTAVDWVCANSVNLALPNGTTTVQGFQTDGTDVSIPAKSTLAVSSYASLSDGTMTGPGSFNALNLTASGTTFAGPGTFTGNANGVLTIDSVTLTSGARLINRGHATLSSDGGTSCQSDSPCIVNGAVLENAGTLDLDNSVSVGEGLAGTPGTMTNDTGATIDTDSSTPSITIPFTNNGTVDIPGGQLTLSNLTAGNGAYDLTGASTLNLSGTVAGGTVTAPDGGTVNLSNATVTAATTISGATNLGLNGDTLNSALTISGDPQIDLTNLSGSGTLTFPAGTNATLSGTAQYTEGVETSIVGVDVVNHGTLTLIVANPNFPNIQLANDAELENAGTLDLDNSVSVGEGLAGTPGTMTNDTGATIDTDSSTPSITIPFTNNGTVDIPGGQLTLSNLTPGTTSTMQFGIGATTSGSASIGSGTLDGTLKLATAKGYSPSAGAQRVLISGGFTGTFTKVEGSKVGAVSWVVSYPPNQVVITAVAG